MEDKTNPKDKLGRAKPGIHCAPAIAILHLGAAMEFGGRKYGKLNWRNKKVLASVYIDAMERHLLAYSVGEMNDEESGLPHLAHVMACSAILLDAHSTETLIDDRMGSAKGVEAYRFEAKAIADAKAKWPELQVAT